MVLLPKLIIPSVGGQAPHGYAVQAWDDGKIVESDILTCGHCGYTWLFLPGSGRKRGRCKLCNAILCGKPRCMAYCTPIEAQLAGEAPGALCDGGRVPLPRATSVSMS